MHIFNSIKKIPFFILLISSLLVSCTEEKKDEQTSQKAPPALVSTKEIKVEDFQLKNEYMGKALGFLSVEVRAQVSGILLKQYYKEGDFVTKGQLLFEIAPSQAQAALNQASAALSQAESALANAQKEYDRILPLYRQNAVSQRDRDTAETNFLSAKANVEAAKAARNQAQINLGYTKVEAPISGYTSLEAVNEGNLISLDSAGSLLTTINQTDPMYINFSFPGSDMTRLAHLANEGKAEFPLPGSKASITTIDGQKYPYEGVLNYYDTQINPLTNSIEARAEFPNPKNGLIPNMYTSITVEGGKLLNVILLPQSAILYTAQGPMAYLVNKENKVELKPLKLGFALGALFIIEDGLKEGDIVVVEGIGKIYPGAEVKPSAQESQENTPQASDMSGKTGNITSEDTAQKS